MWQANKLAQVVYKNPKGTPSFQLTQAQDAYRAIIKKYPNSLFAFQAQFSIGHLFLAKGEFVKARDEYKKLISDCKKKGNLCVEAMFAVGNSYEAEGKWDEANVHYKKIMQDFPFSSKSLDLPIYILRHYKNVNDAAAVKSSVDEAVSFYIGLKSKAKEQKAGYALQTLVVRSYIEGGQWQDALDNLDKLIRDYPEGNAAETLWIKALIYATKLNDKVKAKEELQKIIKENPDPKLTKQIDTIIKKLEAAR
jgi:TolA-binding protein